MWAGKCGPKVYLNIVHGNDSNMYIGSSSYTSILGMIFFAPVFFFFISWWKGFLSSWRYVFLLRWKNSLLIVEMNGKSNWCRVVLPWITFSRFRFKSKYLLFWVSKIGSVLIEDIFVVLCCARLGFYHGVARLCNYRIEIFWYFSIRISQQWNYSYCFFFWYF